VKISAISFNSKMLWLDISLNSRLRLWYWMELSIRWRRPFKWNTTKSCSGWV